MHFFNSKSSANFIGSICKFFLPILGPILIYANTNKYLQTFTDDQCSAKNNKTVSKHISISKIEDLKDI